MVERIPSALTVAGTDEVRHIAHYGQFEERVGGSV